jgi:large subunit ribosomal protein L7/L12
MALSKKEVIDYIKSLPSQELNELIKDLQQELGIVPEASQPLPYVAVVGFPDGAEFVEYEVTLFDVGSSRIKTIQILRELEGVNLADCKYIIENLPKRIKEGISMNEAREWVKKFRAHDAKAEAKAM